MGLKGINTAASVTDSSTTTFTNKTINGSNNTITNALNESSEQSTTPEVDDTSNAPGANAAVGHIITLPSTYKFIKITGIEWKNFRFVI